MYTPTTHALVLLTLTFTLTLTLAQKGADNPMLVQQRQTKAQEKAQQELRRLQQEQMSALSRAPNQGSRPEPRHPPHSPLAPPSRGNNDGGQGRQNTGGPNPNEMHKGRKQWGPGPTPWTRWTPQPRRNKNPWNSQRKSADNLCGGRRYNARDSICCGNNVHKRQGLRPACCGAQAFDFVFSLCCDHKVTPRTAGRPFC